MDLHQTRHHLTNFLLSIHHLFPSSLPHHFPPDVDKMTSYTLTPLAYALPLLHAAAHPESDVAGLLLGPSTPAGSTDSVEVTEALPVLHRYASLSPTMELGIDMARAYGEKKGLRVVGYYEARAGASSRVGEAVSRRWCESRQGSEGGREGGREQGGAKDGLRCGTVGRWGGGER